MKVYRIFYYILMAAALFYALYSGSRLCYLLFFIQLFTCAFALALNLWTIISFSYTQALSVREGQKGQTVILHLTICNDKPFPFTHMRIHIEAPADADCQDIVVNLAPRDEITYDFELSLPYRGEFMVGMTRLDIQDLFGLFPMHIDMRWLPYYHQQPLLVYPRILELTPSFMNSKNSLPHGAQWISPQGHDEYSHSRAWIVGDNSSRIHWKASIKTRSLLTKQYEDPSGENCLIFIDTQPIAQDELLISDRIAECAAAIAYAHLNQQDCTVLACGDPDYRTLNEAFSLADFPLQHQWLALLPFRHMDPSLFVHEIDEKHPDCVYIIGAQVNPSIQDILKDRPVSAFYWTALPLEDARSEMSEAIHVASFYNADLLTFLNSQLGGDIQ